MTGKVEVIFIGLIVFILYANHVQSAVFPDFNRCLQFFYQNTPPFLNGIVNELHICQEYRAAGNYRFATSYDTHNRIPNYSAYKVEFFTGPGQRHNGWFVEPQLSQINNPSMVRSNRRAYAQYSNAQAVDSDYIGSGYDRGHLAPSGYFRQSNDARASTNTLTNIAPQVGPFNQGDWRRLEEAVLNKTEAYCGFRGANRYFITGVIPSYNNTISHGRVNVPDYFWTAVCCDSSQAAVNRDRNEGWSVAFLAENKQHSTIGIYDVENFLSSQARQGQQAQYLFSDYYDRHLGRTIKNCLFNERKADTIIKQIATLGPNFVEKTTPPVIINPTRFQRVCNAVHSAYCYIRSIIG